MTSYLTHVRAFVLIWGVLLCIGAVTTAADRKITRASHEQPVKLEVLETAVDDEPALKSEPSLKSEPAAETTNDVVTSYSPPWPEPPNTGAMLLRLCVGTLVVLGLCAGSLWLGKPYLKRFQVVASGNATFFVEGTVTVGNRATLYLIRAGDTQLVAGTDAGGLKSLIALPPTFKEVLDERVPDVEPSMAAAPAPFDIRSLQRPITRGTP